MISRKTKRTKEIGDDWGAVFKTLPTIHFSLRDRILIATPIVILVIIMVIGIILLFLWPWIIAHYWERLSGAMGSLLARAVALAAVLLISALFYIARTYLRSIYGAAEVCLGMTACWVGLGNAANSGLSASLAIAGGIYVVVRGIDNIMEGRKKNRAKSMSS